MTDSSEPTHPHRSIMKLAIFEPSPFGHHMSLYVRELVAESRERNWNVTLVTTEAALEHAATQSVLNDFGSSLSTHLMPRVETENVGSSRFKLLGQQYRQYKAFRTAFQNMRDAGNIPDVIFLPHLNYFDKILALLKSPFDRVPVAGILQAIQFHQYETGICSTKSNQDRLNRFAFMRLTRRGALNKIFVTDESLNEWLKDNGKPGGRITFIPEFTPSELVTPIEEPKPNPELEQPFVVLIYGSITHRKGFEQLLQVLDDPKLSSKVVVQMGGRIEPELAERTNSTRQRLREAGRLTENHGVLSNSEQASLFGQADLVWVVYRGFMGMSGVLSQAIVAGIPILACKAGLIGWITRKHEIGKTVDPENHQSLVATINQLVDDSLQLDDLKTKVKKFRSQRYAVSAPTIILNELSELVGQEEITKT